MANGIATLTPYLSELTTPCYVYDLNEILTRIALLKKNLPDNVKLYYSIKANSNLHLLKALRDKLDGLDISSGGELEQSVLAGYAPQNFSFAGPGKTEEEIELAIKSGCGSLNAESFDDLTRIDAVAQKLGKTAFVALRISPQTAGKHFVLSMGGQPTQFGFDEEDLNTLPALKHTQIIGLHIYSGSGSLNAAGLKETFENTFALADKLSKKLKINLQLLNIGGGFGIDYFAEQQPLDTAVIYTALHQKAAQYPDLKIILELGRYLTAPAGYYLCRVLNIKQSRGKTFVIVDGGLHHNQRVAGNSNQGNIRNYKITNLTNPESEKLKVELAGCLCTSLDILAVDLELSQPQIGDILCIHNSGAYGYTASHLLFLGHPTPPEYLLENGELKLIRTSKRLLEFN